MDKFSCFSVSAVATTVVLLLSACTAKTSLLPPTEAKADTVTGMAVRAQPLINHSLIDWSKVPTEPDPASF